MRKVLTPEIQSQLLSPIDEVVRAEMFLKEWETISLQFYVFKDVEASVTTPAHRIILRGTVDAPTYTAALVRIHQLTLTMDVNDVRCLCTAFTRVSGANDIEHYLAQNPDEVDAVDALDVVLSVPDPFTDPVNWCKHTASEMATYASSPKLGIGEAIPVSMVTYLEPLDEISETPPVKAEAPTNSTKTDTDLPESEGGLVD